jgi:hypothetical protein
MVPPATQPNENDYRQHQEENKHHVPPSMRAFMIPENISDSSPLTPPNAEQIEGRSVTKSHSKRDRM